MKKGKLYGICVGPGNQELMTLKAVRLVNECDAVAIPGKSKDKCFAFTIAKGAVPNIEEKEILFIDMPMVKDEQARKLAYAKGAEILREELDAGKNIAFLTLGDPTVYSTYCYLHREIEDAGFDTEIVPGVTSFCGAAAVLKEPLCEDKEELHIIPGTFGPTAALDYSGVRVFMKNNIKETVEAAKERGLSVKMVENCGTENQRIYRSADEIPYDAGYFSLIIIKGDK